MFALIPICFNLLIWQNYPISAEHVLPGLFGRSHSPFSLLELGLIFGVFTAVFAASVLACVYNFISALKSETLIAHMQRNRAVYAGLWSTTFTLASFGGFLTVVCFHRSNADANQIFCDGLQGFFVAGVGGALATLIAVRVVALIVISLAASIGFSYFLCLLRRSNVYAETLVSLPSDTNS